MNCRDVLKHLEASGSAQTRKTYDRHGVRGPMFGVSYKELGVLTKRLKGEHELALELWESGIHDARVLATMIADGNRLGSSQIDRWLKQVDNQALGDALASLVARSKFAVAKAAKWRGSKQEWISFTG